MRSITLGNGRLGLGHDDQGRLRDLWWPQVGLENHLAGEISDFGIRCGDAIHWSQSGRPSWPSPCGERGRAELVMDFDEPGLRLRILHVVDPELALYSRTFELVPGPRAEGCAIDLLLHHDFHVLESDLANCVRYLPVPRLLHHYRGDRHFAIDVLGGAAAGIDDWTLGRRDDCDGRGIRAQADQRPLPRNPVAMGAGESLVVVPLRAAAGPGATVEVRITAAESTAEVVRLTLALRDRPKIPLPPPTPDPGREGFSLARLVAAAPALILSQGAETGALLASTDTDLYASARDSYAWCWPRDGAFMAMALARPGSSLPHDLARRAAEAFFVYCARSLGPEGFLPQRLDALGNLGSTWHAEPPPGAQWLPIQEDETALVLVALEALDPPHPALDDLIDRLVRPAARFLRGYVDPNTGLPRPSFDLWEERRAVHTFTVMTVVAALEAAARLLRRRPELLQEAADLAAAAVRMRRAFDLHFWHRDLGRHARAVYPQENGDHHLDMTVDASLSGLFLFHEDAASEPRVRRTMADCERELANPGGAGGYARYVGDRYCRRAELPDAVPGNPWILTTLWMAEWRALVAEDEGDLEEVRRRLDWARRQASPSGLLPEQVDAETGRHLSVRPLPWSHAALILGAERLRRAEARLAK